MGYCWMRMEEWPTASVILAVYLFAALVAASPTITFPINAQVPPVVRVSKPFRFTFSSSTFTGSSSLDYKLSHAPSWLSLDGPTRTLSGVAPESAVNTAPIIQITASDNTGSVTMNTTLVISGNPEPSVVIPLEDQLASFGTYSPPSSILFYPSTPFNITFNSGTFSSRILNHYAVTSENTPLPAWIDFDGASLSYAGKTPDYYSLVEPPQTWSLQLIASDVLGFAGTAIEFNIVVGNHKLDFRDSFLNVNATVGDLLNFTSLIDKLYLDGHAVNMSEIVSADAKTPDWLKFSNSTLALSGTPPAGTASFNVSVTVVDLYGDIANAVMHISLDVLLFSKEVGSVEATVGMPFSYDINSVLFNASDVEVSLQVDPSTPWLLFNNQTLNLSGDTPSNIQPSKIKISIEAISKSSTASGSQVLTIDVVSSPSDIPSRTLTTSTSATTGFTSITSINGAATTGTSNSKHLSRGEISAIIVPLILLFIAIVSLIFFCCKRRRRSSGRRQGNLNKSEISKPVPVSNNNEEELAVPDPMNSSDACTTTIFSSKRHPAPLKRHSKAMSNLVGDVSMNLRDSRSSGTRGRSYSENALSDFGSTWRYTQDNAYPPLRINAARRSSVRSTRNFSRKTSAPLSSTNRSSADLLGSITSKRTSKASKTSIQQTPDFAYDSENIKQRFSRRQTTDHLNIPSVGQGPSGIKHELQDTAVGYSALDKNRVGHRTGHSTVKDIAGSQNQALPREEISWMTIGSAESTEQHRYSAMSALTESTEVLNSPKKITLRQVSRSPSQPAIARVSMSSGSSQPSSKRAVGLSPFFGGSSRAESRGTSRKTLWKTRDRHPYPSSPPGRGSEAHNGGLEKSITAGLRGMKSNLSDTTSALPRDSLGITYGTLREGPRQLREYVSQLGRHVSPSLHNSLQFRDSGSRSISAEHSPPSRHHKEPIGQGSGLDNDRDRYGYSPHADESPGSFNRDRYGIDESPELSQAVGGRAVIWPKPPTAFADPSGPDRSSSFGELTQKRNMPSLSKATNPYGHGTIIENSLTESLVEDDSADSIDNTDISMDGVHGAFL